MNVDFLIRIKTENVEGLHLGFLDTASRTQRNENDNFVNIEPVRIFLAKLFINYNEQKQIK